ncbi:hypothetical protein [Cohnella sp. CFH 77786]|uniref:hypothetical protein n=1 Tax=Cohnella sp. CFH 77786 TaxID=2662265 RepID=UPI002107F536|nr:hypothetical protein [Cohnella sp. CFH 77786]
MLIPIESKQILFCSHDEGDGTFRLHYRNGRIQSLGVVDGAKLQEMLQDQNRYDALIRLIQEGTIP